jgi:hypothetical protein
MLENARRIMKEKLEAEGSGWAAGLAIVFIISVLAIIRYTGIMGSIIVWTYGLDRPSPQSLGGDNGSLPDSGELIAMRR